jgi:hypothetical protein
MGTLLPIVFCFVVVLVLLVVYMWMRLRSQREGWEHHIDKIYQKYLWRPIDIVFESYYRDKDISFLQKDVRDYLYQVKQGSQYMQTQSIAIAGLLRDGQENIPHLQKFYHQLQPFFRTSSLIIVENDSKDGTRKALLDWHEMDSSVVVLCATAPPNAPECNTQDELFSKEYSKTPSSPRIQKMAMLRNVYLHYLQQGHGHDQDHDHGPDYLLVLDMDLQGQLFMDGVCHSMACMEQNPSLDAVACNGMILSPSSSGGSLTYYDSFAYVAPGEEGEWNTLFDKRSHDDEVLRYTSEKYLKGNMELDPVVSAFGGACLYRFSSLKKAKAQYSYSSDRFVCEHTRLHKHLKNMVVNPRMLFLIEKNLH